MASTETLVAFLIAMSVFAYVPGPAILYTAAFGLSALLVYVPAVYTAIKVAGALYLVWLGIGLLRQSDFGDAPEIRLKSARRAFAESIVVEVFNPKAALFFLAFLPQFADPSGAWPVWLQLSVLGVVTLAAFTSADIVTVFAASAVAARAKAGGWVQRGLKWLGGSILIGLGGKLALDNT